jgi:hypothetical protein
VEYVRSPFEPAEYEALSRLAERDLRPVPNEVRHIVREALKQAGLFTPATADKTAPAEASAS